MSLRNKYFLSFAAVSLAYIIITLQAPLSSNRFNLTPYKTHLLQVTIALPVIAIWLVAIYAIERFKNYTQRIQKDSDGQALNKIGTGLTILITSLIFNALYNSFRPWVINGNGMPTYSIIGNYIAVALPLIAYFFIYRGATELQRLIPNSAPNRRNWLKTLLVIIVIAALYLKALLSYKYRHATPNASTYTSLYLPDAAIIFSLALPNLIGWSLGIKATFDIIEYRRKVKGIIYRQALSKLVVGLFGVIGFIVMLQLLIALSIYFAKANLAAILLIVYLLIILYGLGFMIIALGAKQLNAIEEVK